MIPSFASLPRVAAFPLLLAALHASPARAADTVVFTDSFDNATVANSSAVPGFWLSEVTADPNASFIEEGDWQLRMRAANWQNTCAALLGPVSQDFGFFNRAVTISLNQIALRAEGIPEKDGRFRLSIVNARRRAEQASAAITIRYRPGLLLMGYHVADGGKKGPSESQSGGKPTATVFAELEGAPANLSLTLGPANGSSIPYRLFAQGQGLNLYRVGTIELSLEDWGGKDEAALVIEARRDSPGGAGSFAELQLGSVTVTR